MGNGEISPLTAVLPELGLLALAAIILVLDLFWDRKARANLGWVTAGGLLLVAVLSVFMAQPPETPTLIWGGMLRLDGASFVFRMIFLAGAAITALMVSENQRLSAQGEFYALMLVSTLGMSLMASAADLVMLYLAIETTSIPLYILSGFLLRDQKSVEAGLKYLLYGAMTSAVMLYGFSLLYGFTGTTQIYDIAAGFSGQNGLPAVSPAAVIGAMLLVLVGFGFKVSAAPFHFWAPDVYEGAPTAVAGFLSTASKAAGFVVLMRVLSAAFSDQALVWSGVVAALSIGSMVVGNFLALAQKNIKRLLAYSSIAQAGYMLIGVAAAGAGGESLPYTATTYYLLAYLATNLAAFGVVAAVSRLTGSEQIADYRGLNQRAPGLSLALAVAVLSLGGIPPFAGFFGKVVVFASGIQAGLTWLVIIGILNAVVGLYYYLTVLRVVYQRAEEVEGETPLAIPAAWKTAAVLSAAGIVAIGVLFLPWYNLSMQAASSLLTFR